MKISTILDHIDSGHMALPEFQRGYVWNRDQVRGLFDSLYRRHPVGGLLAAELNRRMEELLHGDLGWLSGPPAAAPAPVVVGGSIGSQEEEAELEALNAWVESVGLPRGVLAYDFADSRTDQQMAVFDLAWPSGIQEELSQPVAVLLNEDSATIGLASQAGFRCFTDSESFRRYVAAEVLAGGPDD
jgi:hypothetical protein